MKPWRLRIDRSFLPNVSILVPTYNESEVIGLKLKNLSKIRYPSDSIQIIVVDSNSSDDTINIVEDFMKQNPAINIKVVVESERKGKSAALNFGLKHCQGEVLIVSDADCFWPFDLLEKALPFLSDPDVGAISGPKILMNPNQSWVTRTESAYLDSANLMKLGESKISSTILFEGGFSAYKEKILESFDPYNTGSDDCGTLVNLAEKKSRAIFIPEARFFTTFPITWKGKVIMKLRRANQLMRVLWEYLRLLLRRRITGPKRVMLQNIFIYFISPTMFIFQVVILFFLLYHFPYFAIIFLVFLIPKVGLVLFELVQNYLILFISLFAFALRRKFVIWVKPEDRAWIKEGILQQFELV